MRLVHSGLALSLALMAAPAAWGQDTQAPPRDLKPTRDVTISYVLNNSAQPYMTQSWDSRGQRLRMTTQGEPGWMLIDFGQGHAYVVVDATRRYFAQPERRDVPDPMSLPPDARLTRVGTDRVAGQPCTDWRVESTQLSNATLCISADNVLLRMIQRRPQGEARLEARSVSFTAADPARFRIPPGYQAVRP